MEWARLLAYITGTVDQVLLLRNEYLAAENRTSDVHAAHALTDHKRITDGVNELPNGDGFLRRATPFQTLLAGLSISY